MKKLICIFLFLYATHASAASGDSWNFRFSPIGALLGMVNVEFDYKLSDNWTLGPTLTYWNFSLSGFSIKASSYGAQSRYFFNGVFNDGAYLGLQAATMSIKATITSLGVEYSGESNGAVIGAGGGYHWFWDSFNMNVGGFLYSSPATKIELKDSNGNKYDDQATSPVTGLGIEYTLGWTF